MIMNRNLNELTEIRPTPTKGVKVDVNTELDWTKKVMIAPRRMATYPVSHGTYGISALINFFSKFAKVPRKHRNLCNCMLKFLY